MSYEYGVGGLSYSSMSSASAERSPSQVPSPCSLTSRMSLPSANYYSPTSTLVSVTPPHSPYPKTIILPSRDVPGSQTSSPGFNQDLLWPEMHVPMGHGLSPIDESCPFPMNCHGEYDPNIGTFAHSAALGFHPNISFDSRHTADGSAVAEDLDGQRCHEHSGSHITTTRNAASGDAGDLYLAVNDENTLADSVSCLVDPTQPHLPKRRRFAISNISEFAHRRSNESSAPSNDISRGRSDTTGWPYHADKRKRNWFKRLIRRIVGH